MNSTRHFRDGQCGADDEAANPSDMRAVEPRSPCIAAPALAQTAPSTAIRQQAWDVRGLEGPAEIVVDHWGIPAHLCSLATGRLLPAGLQRRPRPALADRPLAQARPRPAREVLRRVLPGAGPRRPHVPLSRRHGRRNGPPTRPRGPLDRSRPSPPASTPTSPRSRAGAKPLPVEFRLTSSSPEDWKARRRSAHPQPRAGLQHHIRGHARPRRLRRRHRCGRAAPQA